MAGKSDVVVRFIGDTAGLDKSITHATSGLGKMGGTFASIGQKIGGEFGEVLSQAGEGMEKVGEKGHKLGLKLGAAGAVIGGLGLALQNLGSADKQAEDQLKASIEATGASFEEYESQIKATGAAMQDFGHSDDDTNTALRNLTAATNDPKKALESMGLVANIAAAKHISLADASTVVAKVLNGGGGKALKEYGVNVAALENPLKEVKSAQEKLAKAQDKLATAQGAYAAVQDSLHGKSVLSAADQKRLATAHFKLIAAQQGVKTAQEALTHAQGAGARNTDEISQRVGELSTKLDGQAAASTDNFAAKIGIIKTKLGDWAAQMGSVVGPALTTLGPILMGVGAIVEIVGARKAAAAVATTALAVATEGEAVATETAAVAQRGLNLSMLANPIVLVVAAIAALVAGVIYAYTHFEWFRKIVDAVWSGLKTAVSAVVNWFTNTAWPAIKNFIQLQIDAFKTIGTTVKGVWDAVIGWFGKIVSFAQGIPGQITSAVSGMWDGIKDGFRSAINWIIDHWNGIHFKTPDIPGTSFGGVDISAPQIPRLASGGIVSRPTIALIGEAGPEAVVPLSGRGMGGTGQIHNHFHIGTVIGGSEMDVARALKTLMQNAQKSGVNFGVPA